MFISKKSRLFIYKLTIVVYDILALCLSVYLSTLVRFGSSGAADYVNHKFVSLAMSIMLFVGIFYVNGLYDPRQFRGYFKDVTKLLMSVLLGVVASAVIFYATFSFAIGRGIFILMALFIWIFVSLPRVAYLFIVKRNLLDKTAIIVGDKNTATDTINLLKRHPFSLYKVTGIIASGKNILEEKIAGHSVLGVVDNINEIMSRHRADVFIVASIEPRRAQIFKDLRMCMYRGMEIVDLISLYEDLENQIPLKHIDEEWLFSSILNYPNFHVKKVKRLVDILGSALGIIALALPGLLVAVMIKADSKGPVFYRQKRLGKYGRIFRLLKFRSMIRYAERESNGPVWSQENDDRVTRIGKWLRRTRLDEAPQLLNVLMGEMSLVGPRPERPVFIKELSEKIEFYPERLCVQPGLTGWAQINYPYTSNIEESRIKLQYDLYYIKNISFFFDLFILLKTLKTVILSKGR